MTHSSWAGAWAGALKMSLSCTTLVSLSLVGKLTGVVSRHSKEGVDNGRCRFTSFIVCECRCQPLYEDVLALVASGLRWGFGWISHQTLACSQSSATIEIESSGLRVRCAATWTCLEGLSASIALWVALEDGPVYMDS